MKAFLKLAGCFLLAIGLFHAYPSAVFSADEAGMGSAAATTGKLSGTIAFVDADKQYIDVEYMPEGMTDQKTETLSLPATAKIMKAAQAATSADLKAGDKVAVEYSVNSYGKKVIDALTIE